MKNHFKAFALLTAFIISIVLFQCSTHEKTRAKTDEPGKEDEWTSSINKNAKELLEKGRQVFRYETFNDETFWTDKLQIQKSIADSRHGGNGNGLSPKDALAAG